MIVDCISKNLNNCIIEYNQNDSDPEIIESHSKKKNTLNFEPKFSVEQGVLELIDALKIGFYSDSLLNKNKYGNYKLSEN